MTYPDAVDWSIDNVPTDFYDNFDDWFNAVKSELQTPELTDALEFQNKMRDAWDASEHKAPEPEPEPIEEPEIIEPTASDVRHELERNLPPEQQSKGFITQEKAGALSNVLSSLPKGTKISIPQAKGAHIEIKPSVTVPKGITMTRPPTIPFTPTVIRPPVTAGFRQAVTQAGRTITGGIKKVFGVVKGVFRI